MKNCEFSSPTVNDTTLLIFPTFETDKDKMACSKSAQSGKLQKGSNESKSSSNFTTSFSQNFGKEPCYSQVPNYNEPFQSNQNEYQLDLTVTDSCEVFKSENKCSKPNYENNPMDKLMFMQNNYFSSS